MNSPMRRNDWIRTGVAMPAVVLRLGLVAVVMIGALVLIPLIGWQIVAIAAAVVGAVLPQAFGGWIAIACFAVGMLMDEPSIWRAMFAVLVVHVVHVLSSLLLVTSWRGRVVLTALRPTLRRLLLIQLLAQPLTLLVMLLFLSADVTVAGASIAGAAALAAITVLFLLQAKRR